MLLTQDQEMIRDAVRALPRNSCGPTPPSGTRNTTFPKDVHQGLAELGAYGICVPEELGGAGLDYLTLALVLEEIAAGDGGTSTAISVTNCPVNAILMRTATRSSSSSGCVPLARARCWAPSA
jgi:butyryl-CoA dehydrogenase